MHVALLFVSTVNHGPFHLRLELSTAITVADAPVTRVTFAYTGVFRTDDHPERNLRPKEVVVARHVNEAVATGPQPGLWLHQVVVVQLEDAWVYVQVTRAANDQLIVRHGTGEEVRVRIRDAIQVDPIIALLL
ncbi:hypothetical protein PHPALM_30618 [Phytophthora palmivora]|uniref:Uncharacterized protein n=1 Tax=Phytophthora palmivora TaxID=4796 RepID=A0A2P4X4Q9_9STRA|nr:hypothetical protein PHPALM_30618 [Phytophthora palmivora]